MKPKRRRGASRRTRGSSSHGKRGRPEATREAAEAAIPDAVPAQRGGKRPTAVVAIGASAGGLEACTQLLRGLPPNTGMALVIVLHLAPRHASALSSLLGAVTSMPVVQVKDGMALEPNCVYVIPPGFLMSIIDGRLRLIPREEDGASFLPVDYLFQSLAEHEQNGGIAIVLSGTASDGCSGLREVKAAGGIAIAQDPKTAKYDGMPRAAIATGVVDLVLSPEEMAAELSRMSLSPTVRHARPHDASDGMLLTEHQFGNIVQLLRKETGVDFGHYKQPTVRRRVHRRMLLHKISRLDEYIRLLQKNAPEVRRLFNDILIHVTRFFRDPESFDLMAKEVFPSLLKGRESEAPIRIWAPGCSSGEEAYSVAMVLIELMGNSISRNSIQVFGTDISESSVEQARAGSYPDTISGDVPAERLRRFFTKFETGYKINKAVRDLCVFARHDLTHDPPFSKLDFILCRNVLIYLEAVVQRRLLTVFHYALKPSGFMMLGSAETTGPSADLFVLRQKKWKLYTKKSAVVPVDLDLVPAREAQVSLEPRKSPTHFPYGERELLGEANRVLISRYAPPGVLIDDDMQILQFRGHTGSYLEPASGDPTLSLMKMLRQGLMYGVRSAIADARKKKAPSRRDHLLCEVNGKPREVNVEVIPVTLTELRSCFLVLFEDAKESKQKADTARPASKSRGKQRQEPESTVTRQLREELAANRDYLQSIIQDVEAANEELQSANEEILSSNEELQSTNEELDTAKEELQSSNEELNTLNEELHGRNEELSRVNSDLFNLLSSVQIAIVMVDHELRIRRFTPMAEKMLNLIPGDVGRPISDIHPKFECPDLSKLMIRSVDTISVTEREVRDDAGNWYSLQIRPYKNLENRIDGAVLSLFDISSSDKSRSALSDALGSLEGVLELSPNPFLVLDVSMRVKRVNRAFLNRFGVSAAAVEKLVIYELGDDPWKQPALRTCLEEVLPQQGRCHGFELAPASDGHGPLLLDGRRLPAGDGRGPLTVLSIREPVPGAEALPEKSDAT